MKCNFSGINSLIVAIFWEFFPKKLLYIWNLYLNVVILWRYLRYDYDKAKINTEYT